MGMRYVSLGFAAWLIVSVSALSRGAAGPAEGPDLKSVMNALRVRREVVRTCDYEWTAEEFRAAKSMPLSSPQGEIRDAAPDEDVAPEQSLRLTLDGQRLRLFFSGDIYSHSGSFIHSQVTLVFNGKPGICKRLNRPHDSGTIATPRRFRSLLGFAFWYPVIQAYRLFDPELDFVPPGRARIAGYSEVDGLRCVVVEEPFAAQEAYLRRVSLAVDRGLNPVHVQSMRTGEPDQVTYDARLEYEPHPEIGWRLIGWSYGAWDPKHGFQNVKVKRADVNVPIPPETFALVFPPGTQVGDEILLIRYVLPAFDAADVADVVPESASPPTSPMSEFVERVRIEAPAAPPPAGEVPAPLPAAASETAGRSPWIARLAGLGLAVIGLAVIGWAFLRRHGRPGSR